jgi:DNA-binding XRE family transcriptional regulator
LLDPIKLQLYDIINNYPTKNFPIKFTQMSQNALKKIRESLMISRAELARKANIYPFTIARVENGKPCRLETKRKIILALGFKIADKYKVFGD